MSTNLFPRAFAAVVVSLATCAQADVLVTENTGAVADNPKNRAIAQCVRAIYDHWPAAAGLVLPNQGRMAIDQGIRTITIRGFVWQAGERRHVDHECRSKVRGTQVALLVSPDLTEPLQIVAQVQ